MRGKQKRASAGDIMGAGVVTAENSSKLLDVARTMADKKIGSIVVVNLSREPIGLITETDILRTISKYEQKFFDLTAQDIMSKPLITIPATADVERVEKEMKRHKIKHMPVISSGKLVGIVTTKNLVDYLGKWEIKD
ncbi:MAG: hypothetical protein CVT88_06380 [Candidatus Altiarchaeales archaeon HGW-Altiarchaeales-1]|nr:MAG: hypothetical protein CVT88_06380 [Candidatus Altiarchaeales archaeon HGW-Altiarchaeales-1]